MGFPDGSVPKTAFSSGAAGDMGFIPGSEDLLEEGPAIHSSILAWKILWTEDFGRLQSIGSQ